MHQIDTNINFIAKPIKIPKIESEFFEIFFSLTGNYSATKNIQKYKAYKNDSTHKKYKRR